MEKYCNLKSLLFNIGETIMLIGMAELLQLGVINTLIIFFAFEIARSCFKLPKHYKQWQQCLIWTFLIFTSLFVVSRVDITVGVMCAIFTSYILSGKADIKEFFLWNKDASKYSRLIEYIKFNGLNERLIECEKKLKELDNELYIFYVRKFREGKTFQQISDEFEIDNPRIVEALDKVYYYFIGALGI